MKVEKEKVKAAKAKEIEADVIFDQPPQVLLNSMLLGLGCDKRGEEVDGLKKKEDVLGGGNQQ